MKLHTRPTALAQPLLPAPHLLAHLRRSSIRRPARAAQRGCGAWWWPASPQPPAHCPHPQWCHQQGPLPGWRHAGGAHQQAGADNACGRAGGWCLLECVLTGLPNLLRK